MVAGGFGELEFTRPPSFARHQELVPGYRQEGLPRFGFASMPQMTALRRLANASKSSRHF